MPSVLFNNVIIVPQFWQRYYDTVPSHISFEQTPKGIEYHCYHHHSLTECCLSPRPFQLGQLADMTTHACVYALYVDFCESYCLHPVYLLRRFHRQTGCLFLSNGHQSLLRRAWQEGVVYPSFWHYRAFRHLLQALRVLHNDALANYLHLQTQELFPLS